MSWKYIMHVEILPFIRDLDWIVYETLLVPRRHQRWVAVDAKLWEGRAESKEKGRCSRRY